MNEPGFQYGTRSYSQAKSFEYIAQQGRERGGIQNKQARITKENYTKEAAPYERREVSYLQVSIRLFSAFTPIDSCSSKPRAPRLEPGRHSPQHSAWLNEIDPDGSTFCKSFRVCQIIESYESSTSIDGLSSELRARIRVWATFTAALYRDATRPIQVDRPSE